MRTANRRALLGAMIGLAAGAKFTSSLLKSSGGEGLPAETIVDMYLASREAIDVSLSFANADFPTLTTSYAAFFPQLLEQENALDSIRNAVQSKILLPHPNRHRLVALPAVTAVHLLPSTLPSDQDELHNEVFDALLDRRREVREIILQNLINVASANGDAIRYFSINTKILDAIELIVDESKATDKLLSPLSLCADFLLNMRWLLRARNEQSRCSQRVESSIDAIKSSDVPHFFLIKLQITEYESLFASHEFKTDTLLPPQRGERLLGWRRCPADWRNFNRISALIQARVAFSAFQTAQGRDNTHLDVMNAQQAKFALPKILSIAKHHEELLPARYLHSLQLPSDQFSNFMQHDFLALRASAVMPPSNSVQECFPISRFTDDSAGQTLRTKLSGVEKRRWQNVLQAAGDAVIDVLSSIPSAILGDWALKQFSDGKSPSSTNGGDDLKERIVSKARECDASLGELLDRKQSRLGPAIQPDETFEKSVPKAITSTAKSRKRQPRAKR